MIVSGRVRAPTCSAAPEAATDYTRTLLVPARCAGSCSCGAGNGCVCVAGTPRCEVTLGDLSPGEWLHRVEAAATGQRQSRRALVMGDSSTAAAVDWTAYGSVLIVSSSEDGRGPGTLRQAVARASADSARPPTLIRFDHGSLAGGSMTVRLTDRRPLQVSRETVIDGTDADGNPSPLAPFAARSYPTIIELDPTDAGAAHAATLRFTGPGSGLRGVYLRRLLGADDVIRGRDQDLVAFGPGATRGFVESSRLDGGSAHRVMQDCPGNTAASLLNPAQGKDCIGVSGTGSLALADAVVVSESEVRHCYDRPVKSRNAGVLVRDSWIHHNLRGGLFAMNPNGKLLARRNLVEENGKNCPAATRCQGGPRDGMSCCPAGLNGSACAPAASLPGACPGSADRGCGSGRCVPLDGVADVSAGACGVSATRPGAAQMSAQNGTGTDLRTEQNVLRNGTRSGVFYRDAATGSMSDDFVCGMDVGVETTTAAGSASPIVVSGIASVLNRRAGVLLNRSGGAVAQVDFGDVRSTPRRGTRNAFSNNGGPNPPFPNFRAGSGGPSRKAEGNQWQSGGGGAGCDAAAVRANDVAPANARLDVDPCEAPRSPSGGTAVEGVFPSAARAGAVVHVLGSGFNAIDGYGRNDGPGGAATCSTLAAGNVCATTPRGTCVEFERSDGGWSPATAILAVTPTHLVVESPIDCAAPGRVRVRRKLADGRSATFTSSTPIFCRND